MPREAYVVITFVSNPYSLIPKTHACRICCVCKIMIEFPVAKAVLDIKKYAVIIITVIKFMKCHKVRK